MRNLLELRAVTLIAQLQNACKWCPLELCDETVLGKSDMGSPEFGCNGSCGPRAAGGGLLFPFLAAQRCVMVSHGPKRLEDVVSSPSACPLTLEEPEATKQSGEEFGQGEKEPARPPFPLLVCASPARPGLPGKESFE